MSIDTPPPIRQFEPAAPDADWETIRARTMAHLVSNAATAWTDHNLPDPGVTLAEAAAFAIADVHYRLAEATFAQWPLTWRGWEGAGDRHWDTTLPPPSLSLPVLGELADALAAASGIAGRNLNSELAASATRADAEALLVSAPWAGAIPGGLRGPAIEVIRGRRLLTIALEGTDVIADAVGAADAVGGSRADRDARAAQKLTYRLDVWDEEAAALVRRERELLAGEAAHAKAALAELVASAGDLAALIADLEADGLDADEARLAAAAPWAPFATDPEDLEAADGSSLIWPPHPIQALTCEPVVAGDYARRARTHTSVRRAWAVPGRLEGIAWNGLATPDPAFLAPTDPRRAWAVDEDAKAVTIVVECPAATAPAHQLLRDILGTAIGSESRTPFPSWRDNVDALDPRRLLCDEVGIALLKRVPVIVQATLVIPPTASRTTVKAMAVERVAAFFDAGRPESAVLAVEDSHTGPWPPAPQPPGGWIPGESVRFSEVVAILVGIPEVIAVREVAMMVATDPGWTLASAGELAIPVGAVPELVDGGCFTTDFHVAGACSDA